MNHALNHRHAPQRCEDPICAGRRYSEQASEEIELARCQKWDELDYRYVAGFQTGVRHGVHDL